MVDDRLLREENPAENTQGRTVPMQAYNPATQEFELLQTDGAGGLKVTGGAGGGAAADATYEASVDGGDPEAVQRVLLLLGDYASGEAFSYDAATGLPTTVVNANNDPVPVNLMGAPFGPIPITPWGTDEAAPLTTGTTLAADTELCAANYNRCGLIIGNDTDKKMYVKFGDGASTSSWSIVLAAGENYEASQDRPYRGQVTAAWEAGAAGRWSCTELNLAPIGS